MKKEKHVIVFLPARKHTGGAKKKGNRPPFRKANLSIFNHPLVCFISTTSAVLVCMSVCVFFLLECSCCVFTAQTSSLPNRWIGDFAQTHRNAWKGAHTQAQLCTGRPKGNKPREENEEKNNFNRDIHIQHIGHLFRETYREGRKGREAELCGRTSNINFFRLRLTISGSGVTGGEKKYHDTLQS